MTRSLLYLFHKQPKFGRFSFFDSGKNIPYFDSEKENSEIAELIENNFSAWLTALEAVPSISVSCVLSGYVLRIISLNKKLTKQFKKLIDSSQIELVLSPHYNSLSALISKDLFLKELITQKEVLGEMDLLVPVGIWNSATIYSDDLADVLAELGMTYAVAPRLPWYLPESSKDSPFFKSTNKKLNLAVAGEITNAEKLDGEIILLNGLSPDSLSLLQDTKLHYLSIEKALAGVKLSDIYSLPDLVAMHIGGGKLEDYVGNSLQKDFLDRLKKLSSSILKPSNITYTEDFLWIGSADHFLKISNKEAPAQRYTNFVVLQNMLYDLELKLR